MKALFKTLLITLLLCLGFAYDVKAYTYTEEYVIDRTKNLEEKTKDLVDDLTVWSNDYSHTAKSILTKDFLKKLDSEDYEYNIDLVIQELVTNGHSQASNELSSMKQDILNNISYLEETFNIIETYLKENVDNGVIGSTDLFIQIRSSLKELKQPASDLAKIYYDMYYDDVTNKIDKYDSVSELMSLYEKVLDKLEDYDYIITKIEDKLDKWQYLYNEYHLEDYEDLFKEEFSGYYSKVRGVLEKIYTKLESKLQKKLDDKITYIVDNTEISSIESMVIRNQKIYDIIYYIEDIKNEFVDKYSEIDSYIKIDIITDEIEKYETKIVDRFNEAIDYTKTYLLDVFDIGVKKDTDKPFVTVDKYLGIIVYDSKDLLSTTFVNKLFTTVGDFNILNTYKNNIGTLSILRIMYNNYSLKEFKIVVKGDVSPSGRIDISDVVKLCNKMFGKYDLDMYEFMAADMNDDSKIDITDVVKLCNKMFK